MTRAETSKRSRFYAPSIRAGRTRISIVDQDDEHVYQPGLLFVPFGIYSREKVTRVRHRQVHRDVTYVYGRIHRVVTAENRVYLSDQSAIDYDVLIVATGTRVVPEETEGLTGAGWRESMSDFYTVEGATALREKLALVDMFGLARDDFIEELEGIITVGEFYQLAAGGQIIFT